MAASSTTVDVIDAPRTSRLTGAERQSSILKAATEVFAHRGYEGARIEEIASTAGVSKALIYEHFEGKKELYAQIMNSGTQELLARVLEAAAPGKGSVERMERGLATLLDFVAESPNRWRVIQQEVSDPEIVELDHNNQVRGEQAIAMMLATDEEIARQNLSDDQLDLLGVMINGASVRAADWWIDNQSMGREEVLRYLMRFMWVGLDRIRRADLYNGNGKPSSRGSANGAAPMPA